MVKFEDDGNDSWNVYTAKLRATTVSGNIVHVLYYNAVPSVPFLQEILQIANKIK